MRADSGKAFLGLVNAPPEPLVLGLKGRLAQGSNNTFRRHTGVGQLAALTPPVLDQNFDGDLRPV